MDCKTFLVLNATFATFLSEDTWILKFGTKIFSQIICLKTPFTEVTYVSEVGTVYNPASVAIKLEKANLWIIVQKSN